MPAFSASKQHTVLQSTVYLTCSSLLLQILGFCYRILLSRMLTSQQMGVYGLMMPVYALLSSATLSGFSVAAVRITADFAGSGDALQKRAAAVLKTAFLLYGSVFCAAVCIFSPIAPYLAKLLGEPTLTTAFLLLLPCLLMTAFENIFKSVFQGVQNVIPSMISECTEQLVRILAVWGLLSAANVGKRSGGAACALVVCGMMASEVVSDVILGRFGRSLLRMRGNEKGLGREILRQALPVSGGNACGMLLSSVSGTMIPTALMRYGMSHAEALSAYGELTGMLLPLLSIPGAFVYPLCTVMLPRITEALASGNKKMAKRRIDKTLWTVGMIAVCFTGAAVVFAPMLCEVCFGERYPAGSGSIIALGIASMSGLISAGAGCVLNARGRQNVTVATGLVLGTAEVPLLYWAVGRWGIAGYAAVSAAVGIVQGAVMVGYGVRGR